MVLRLFQKEEGCEESDYRRAAGGMFTFERDSLNPENVIIWVEPVLYKKDQYPELKFCRTFRSALTKIILPNFLIRPMDCMKQSPKNIMDFVQLRDNLNFIQYQEKTLDLSVRPNAEMKIIFGAMFDPNFHCDHSFPAQKSLPNMWKQWRDFFHEVCILKHDQLSRTWNTGKYAHVDFFLVMKNVRFNSKDLLFYNHVRVERETEDEKHAHWVISFNVLGPGEFEEWQSNPKYKFAVSDLYDYILEPLITGTPLLTGRFHSSSMLRSRMLAVPPETLLTGGNPCVPRSKMQAVHLDVSVFRQ